MKLLKIILVTTSLFTTFCSCTDDEGDSNIITTDDMLLDNTDDDTANIECSTSETVAQSSDVQIETMRQAMVSFRTSLSETLLNESSNCLDDERFILWHNTPANNDNRNGITYGDLTDEQLINFKDLMQLFLSTEGYQKVFEITELSEGWLSDIMSDTWNPDFYSIDMFGDPETSGSWGFQLDGHHCVINFLVHGDNISIVPAFLAGEPAKETYNGTEFDIFSNERDLALDLYNGLNDTELSSAIANSARSLEFGPADRNGDPDPFIGDYDYSGFETGLKYSDMSSESQANLILVMQEYVYNLNTTFANVWWADILDNIDDTYFVWIDEVDVPDATSQFYYRIYNPYLWVEFNTEDVTGANSRTLDAWNHIHTITRIPNNPATDNGGDYGIFAHMINQDGPKTLYEHYVMADHHKLKMINFDYKVNTLKKYSKDHGHQHNG